MNGTALDEIDDLHWTLGLIQNLEVGLVVVDRKACIKLWNGFMANHSGLPAQDVVGEKLFDKFPDLPTHWLHQKLETVFLLRNPAYISWEQRPYLFNFKNNRPITGYSKFMYQNITLIPLTSPTGDVDHIGILIYDVTDTATGQIALENANQKLKKLSREDRLTGLNNRGYWEECLNREFERYNRTELVSSLVMFDIDHFKKVNDTYGHQAGDEVIRAISQALQIQARKTDIAGRYGGEEFGAVLTGTNGVNAMIFAERLRANVESLLVKHGEYQINCTISLGVSELNEDVESATAWLEQADKALYQSKQNGRNGVTLFSV
ncbi:diguanylate cyclase [Neptuniibacter pectenicola]|jgi:diguanylate cyclase (GGDEF)-like protein|uniref:diguanylate cyclase n=1 Tax=Neptuniibacter pectenicola TaxID=1806669 RepID=A0ABU9TPA5_9GAMM|tara:strand:- start:4425 stop:5387 length:963 start_codon:yes stop_codon:yes gene_type:complete